MVAVGAVPKGPLGGGTAVVPAYAVGGIGHHVGTKAVDGLKKHLEFEPRVGEGVAITGELYAEIARGRIDFDRVDITVPIQIVPNPSSFIKNGQVIVRVNVGATTEYYWNAQAGVQVQGLAAVVMVVVWAAWVKDCIALVDIERT